MNTVEIDDALRDEPRWSAFAGKLSKSLTEYHLDGVCVFLRELRADELTEDPDHQVLTFCQDTQRFQFAVKHGDHLPAPWTVADRIDGFLNPEPEDLD